MLISVFFQHSLLDISDNCCGMGFSSHGRLFVTFRMCCHNMKNVFSHIYIHQHFWSEYLSIDLIYFILNLVWSHDIMWDSSSGWVFLGWNGGMCPIWYQMLAGTDANLLLIGPLMIKFLESIIKMWWSYSKEIYLKMSPAKYWSLCSGFNEVTCLQDTHHVMWDIVGHSRRTYIQSGRYIDYFIFLIKFKRFKRIIEYIPSSCLWRASRNVLQELLSS